MPGKRVKLPDPLGLFGQRSNPQGSSEIERILSRTADQLMDARDTAHHAYTTLDKILNIPYAYPTGFSPQSEFARIGQALDNLESSIRILREKEVEVRTGKPISQSEREAIRARVMKVRPRG